MLATCRSDPWDVSRQVTLPLAYPGGYLHDILGFKKVIKTYQYGI
jgi:hypothetical protein